MGRVTQWVALTNAALIGVILLMRFGEGIGRAGVVLGAAAICALWAGCSTALLQGPENRQGRDRGSTRGQQAGRRACRQAGREMPHGIGSNADP
jgi:hypothetical protein